MEGYDTNLLGNFYAYRKPESHFPYARGEKGREGGGGGRREGGGGEDSH